MKTSKRQRLRQMLKESTVYAPFVYDGITALLAERSGCRAVYLTGFGTAASHGLADVGLITLTEISQRVRIIDRSCSLPVIADADTGYGNYTNVMRTVREYEHAGVAALHLEDQVWPKRCGYMANKQVIDRTEAANKIKAALDARVDEDMIIIARTDALAVSGWEEVEERAASYLEAGADMVFVDGIKTLDDVEQYAKRLSNYSCVFNNVPNLPMAECDRFGTFPLVLNSGPMSKAWIAYEEEVGRFAKTGNVSAMDVGEYFRHLLDVLNVQHYFDIDQKYSTEK
ncbi:isocitrate lyase/PEP mutase family protein [Desulfitobacterium hafniense]|uniref:isocitrate lyase/PEP mutase family protein n=1 Tax=Desulfitobacterium hafniense TaxID=49338 RepID=UPI000367DC6D|nr:isocitrate lyase/PEP mutase family protein [Desulfitobacterium hafniense]